MDDFEITFEGFETEAVPANGYVYYRWPSGRIVSVGLYRDEASPHDSIVVAAGVVLAFLEGRRDTEDYYVGTKGADIALMPRGKRFVNLDPDAEIAEIATTEAPVFIMVEHLVDEARIGVSLVSDSEVEIDAMGITELALMIVPVGQNVVVETITVSLPDLFSEKSLIFPVNPRPELRVYAQEVLPMAFCRVSEPVGHLKPRPDIAGLQQAEEGPPEAIQITFSADRVCIRVEPALGDLYRRDGDTAFVVYADRQNASALLGGFSFSSKQLFETLEIDIPAAPPPEGARIFVTRLAAAVSYNQETPCST
jgi:hypothetical protein